MSPYPARPDYQTLLRAIKKEIEQGSQKALLAVGRQAVVTNWEIGRYLNRHLLLEEKRSPVNSQIIKRLSRDLHKPDTYFYAAAKFHRFYPVLPKPCALSWSHYVQLIRIDDSRQRALLEQKAVREHLSNKDLKDIIMEKYSGRTMPAGLSAKLPVVRGRLYHYQITSDKRMRLKNREILVDIGFKIRRAVAAGNQSHFQSGLVVRSHRRRKGIYEVRLTAHNTAWLYTYTATVRRVVDGDTLVLDIDCGFRTWFRETVRLRGIDCPEVSSFAGRRAKEFVRKLLPKDALVVVKTYREGKYGRFLADIFFDPGRGDKAKIASQGEFLNQRLLDEGLAGIMR